MAQSLQFTKAHATLTVIDSVNGLTERFTGGCSMQMVLRTTGASTASAEYKIFCSGREFKFFQEDINLIAGSAPSGTPATDEAAIWALLPLYA